MAESCILELPAEQLSIAITEAGRPDTICRVADCVVRRVVLGDDTLDNRFQCPDRPCAPEVASVAAIVASGNQEFSEG